MEKEIEQLFITHQISSALERQLTLLCYTRLSSAVRRVQLELYSEYKRLCQEQQEVSEEDADSGGRERNFPYSGSF